MDEIPKKDDSFLAIGVLLVLLVVVILVSVYIWNNRKMFGFEDQR